MNASKNGTNTSKVNYITSQGFYLSVNDKEYYLSFEEYPYFKQVPVEDIFNVEIDEYGDLRWDKYDIDLCEEILQSPETYPLKMKITASEMGRKGGHSRTTRKRRASRLNGKLGGRPKKKEKVEV